MNKGWVFLGFDYCLHIIRHDIFAIGANQELKSIKTNPLVNMMLVVRKSPS